MSVEEAKLLLNDLNLTDEEISQVIADLKILCEVAAEVYRRTKHQRAA